MSQILFPSDLSQTSRKAFQFAEAFAKAIQFDLTLLYTYHAEETYYLKRLLWSSRLKKFAWNKMLIFARTKEKEVPNHVKLRLRKGKLNEHINQAVRRKAYKMVAYDMDKFNHLFYNQDDQSFVKPLFRNPILLSPKNGPFIAPRNILVLDEDYESINKKIQQEILGLSLKFKANIHYVKANEQDEWSFKKEHLSRGINLVQKSVPSDILVSTLLSYMLEKSIGMVLVGSKGRSFLGELLDSQMFINLNIPVIYHHYKERVKEEKSLKIKNILNRDLSGDVLRVG